MLFGRKFLALATLVPAAAAVAPEPARADDKAVVSCTLAGATLPAIDTLVYDGPTGAEPIAKLTGAKVTLTASDFFAGGGDRVKVQTSGFRIEGWVDASRLSLYPTRDVPVVQNHIFIAAQREVKATGAGPGKLRVKRQVGSPFSQAFSGWAPCSALSLTPSTPSGWSPEGHAVGYVAKKDVELYDSGEDGRSLISMLSPDPSSDGILLWSTERKGNWVHLVHHSDVVIDAWARASDLKKLPRGETQDFQPGPVSTRSPPTLKLGGTATVKSASTDLEIRASASDKGKVVGKLEAGTEVYQLDVVAGWASVLPKSLSIVAPGEAQFWVKAKGLSP